MEDGEWKGGLGEGVDSDGLGWYLSDRGQLEVDTSFCANR